MLRRVAITDLRVGMYVHALEGPWFRHPFWRRRFLIANEGELAILRDAGIEHVTIDESRGAKFVESPAETEGPVAEEAAPVESASAPLLDETPTSVTAERDRATEIIARSTRVMRGIFDGARLGKTFDSEDVIAVVDEVSASVRRNQQALIGIVRLKSKDEYTYLHSVAVCALMVNLARQLGLDDATAKDMGLAGLVHDIGKMGVPDEVLNKPGRLDDHEFDIIRSHPERGVAMLQINAIPDMARDVCLHHHEKIDGTGYPYGLTGGQLSLAARMGAICDVYDALTSNRAYKAAWSPGEAITAMASWNGQFDPELLFAFFQSIGVFPAGMLVRTRSNHLAVVLSNGRRATRPRLRLFFDIGGDHLIAPRDLVVADGEAGDRIVMAEDATNWRAHDWPTLCTYLQRETGQLDPIEIERLWTGAGDAVPVAEAPSGGRISTWRPGQAPE